MFETRDKELLLSILRRNTPCQLYALADLDEPYWKDTRWFVGEGQADPPLVLLLSTLSLPILYAVAPPGDSGVRSLIRELAPELPKRFFAHVALDALADLNGASFAREGEFYKMRLGVPVALPPAAVRVEEETRYEILQEFYDRRAYGDDSEQRFFTPAMIEAHPYFVVRERGEIVCAAGVHVASRRYSVAAIGNIATAPAARGKGLATAVTGALIASLRPRFRDIGLNVRTDNAPALACYRRLGFSPCLTYEEGVVMI